MRVEAGADDHEPGVERPHGRLDDLVERGEVGLVTRARGERDVQRRRVVRAGATGARIERPLVQRHAQHGVVAAKDRLGAVPVVDVPVDDRDPFDPELHLRVAGGDSCVAEDAEPHRVRRHRVVAGRADECEAAELDGADGAAGGETGGLPRGRAAERVAVEPELLPQARDELDIGGIVHPLDRLATCAPALQLVGERLEEPLQPLRPLGMVVPARGMQVRHRRVADDVHYTAPSRRVASPASPSSCAAAAPAAQSGSRSSTGRSGAAGSSVAMLR